MRWLLRLYPRSWRRRYRDEVEALLASEPRSIRLWLDLIAGAIDARLNPQWNPASSSQGGERVLRSILCSCRDSRISSTDWKRSAVWMIGATLGLVLLNRGLVMVFGDSLYAEALLVSSFSMAFLLSSQPTFLKPYSRTARTVFLVFSLVGVYGFFLGVSLLGEAL